MGLLTRFRDRVQPRVQPRTIGEVLTPALEKEWEELPEQVDAFLKKVGSAVVATWEVGAADLGRVVIAIPKNQEIIDRYSDALVPTLAPYQDLHKRCNSQMNAALQAARKSGFSAAVPELMAMVANLGPRVAEGWVQTVDYLGPVLAHCKDPAGVRAELLRTGPHLDAGARAAEPLLRAGLQGLPAATSLYDGVCDPFEAWQLAVGREVEIRLDAATRILIAGLKR